MKRFRLLLLSIGAALALLGLAAGVALHPSFQTWLVRRQLARVQDARVSVEQVQVTFGRVVVRDLRLERDGWVLVLPMAEAELPVWSAAVSRRFEVRKLVARAWSLDGTRVAAPAADAGSQPASGLPAAAAVAAPAFAGVFGHLQLPIELTVDALELQGLMVLPQGRGTVRVTVAGGGLGAGREAKFELNAGATLQEPRVNALEARGTVLAAMDTPRSFSRLAVKLDASATGPQLPGPVRLTAGGTAARAAGGETYSLTLVSHERQLLALKAELPRDASRLEGSWKVDLRHDDVAPFALGQPLPVFSALGEGKFDADADFSSAHLTGRLETAASRLEILQPRLVGLGAIKVAADFDVARRRAGLAVDRLEATISSTHPVATVRALQRFEFDPSTREVRASDPARELFGVACQGVPLAWVTPWLEGTELSGGDLRGEFVASARGGGMTVRSRAPFVIDGLGVERAGTPWVRQLDLSFNTVIDYTPQGWQAEFGQVAVRSEGKAVVGFDARVGRLAGPGQPLKATGKMTTNLPALLAQPAAAAGLALTAGNASADFAVSVGQKTEVHARVAVDGLATRTGERETKLPSIAADVRADIADTGQIDLGLPLVVELAGRRSDLNLVGRIGPLRDASRAIEAQLTSTQLVLDDVRLLAALVPEKGPASAAGGATPPPPWAGFRGAIALQLKKVIYSETFELTHVAGKLQLEPGSMKLEGLKLGLGPGGIGEASAALTYGGSSPPAYGLAAEVALTDVESGPLIRAVTGESIATIEGVFDVASRFRGEAASLDGLRAAVRSDFTLNSRGGTFRGLPVNAATLAENTSKFAAWLSSAGSALGLTGRRDYGDIASKSQAVAEFARALSAIPYDQLSVRVTRDSARNLTLEDFALISPETRLTGKGTSRHRPGTSFADRTLAMDFQLRARGRQGDLLRFLGAVEGTPDDLGYAGCVLPIKVAGTLGKPDTSELNGRLAALAVEKSGVTEKASELFNRIIGGGK